MSESQEKRNSLSGQNSPIDHNSSSGPMGQSNPMGPKSHESRRGPMRGPMHGPMMGRPVEKAKDFKGTLKRLLTYLKPRSFQLLMVFVLAILSTVFSIISPKILGQATTLLFEGMIAKFRHLPGAGIDVAAIGRIVVLLIGLYLISALFSYFQQFIMAGVAQNFVYHLRSELNEKLNRLPLKFFDTRTHGELLSRVTNDVDNISTTLQQSLTQLITSLVTILGVIVMMLTISPLMTLIVLITLPLSFLVTINVAKRSQKFFANQQKTLGELNGHVEEMYTGHTIVKAFGREKDALKRFDEINQRLFHAGWRAQFISGIIMPLMMFIGNIGYILVSITGGILVTKKAIEIGDIQAFIQYSRQFSHPITQTANIMNIIQSTIASAERVFEIIDEVEEIPDRQEVKCLISEKDKDKNEPGIPASHEKLPRLGQVTFEGVSFRYKDDEPLIENMNLNIKPGQTVAIVGPTGAGKTTLVNLLMRFFELDKGSIRIDGIDIREIPRGELRRIFGMVLQDTWLFNGTIRANIAYGKEGATEEEIIWAAKAAHADHFIRTLPEGYDTVLNEEASNISQGQKQLLTIARAILANPSILILDEATSNVDTRTEVYIQKAMQTLMQGRTNFVIAHRLSTIRNADRILVMNHGRIIESGTHPELLTQGGFYADLYYSQFQGVS